jgi:hypothetical protein
MKTITANNWGIVLGALVFTALCLAWEYFNGGVVTHHLLARDDMPGASNWWGLLTIPLLAWWAVQRVKKRQLAQNATPTTSSHSDTRVIKRFLIALVFGLMAGLAWEFGFTALLPFYIWLPVLLALFIPVHYTENLLGFCLGMLFTFGGILPIVFGSVLLVLGFLVYTLVRWVVKRILPTKA